MASSRPDRRSGARAPDVARALTALPIESMTADLPAIIDQRSVIIVLGMHRSGTSLLSNVLHYLGADMADETDHISSKNAGGFWERPELNALQDEILAQVGRPLTSPLHSQPLRAGWWRDKEIAAFRRKLSDYVHGQLSQTTRAWGFKDPRTCRLLPLWADVFRDLELTPRYVWAIRSPGEASASMAKKNPSARPLTVVQAELMWLSYNFDIIRYAAVHEPFVVDYREWFENPVPLARSLTEKLRLPGLGNDAELAACIRRFVNSELQHEVEGSTDARTTIPIIDDLYRDIRQLAQNPDSKEQVLKYVPLFDLVFRTTLPFAEQLVELPELKAAVKNTSTQIAELTTALQSREVQLTEQQMHEQRQRETAEDKIASLKARCNELTGFYAAREREVGELAASLKAEWARATELAERLKAETRQRKAKEEEAAELAKRLDAETAHTKAKEEEAAELAKRLDAETAHTKAKEEEAAELAKLLDVETAQRADLAAKEKEVNKLLARLQASEALAGNKLKAKQAECDRMLAAMRTQQKETQKSERRDQIRLKNIEQLKDRIRASKDEQRKLAGRLRELESSISWKLTAPLRMLRSESQNEQS